MLNKSHAPKKMMHRFNQKPNHCPGLQIDQDPSLENHFVEVVQRNNMPSPPRNRKINEEDAFMVYIRNIMRQY